MIGLLLTLTGVVLLILGAAGLLGTSPVAGHKRMGSWPQWRAYGYLGLGIALVVSGVTVIVAALS